jgi:hypothetical protein
MKFNHTNIMKDDSNKPEAPEGYTAMLGRDVPTPIEDSRKLLVWLRDGGGVPAWVRALYHGVEKIHPENLDRWFAVPNPPPSADPKASQAVQKPQLQLIPPALNEETAKALMRGAKKYGFFNWRENKVEMMTYLGAMKRHIDCLIEGEDIDPDTGAHHLGCVAAGCGIVLDARKHGTLVDNRPPKGQNTP